MALGNMLNFTDKKKCEFLKNSSHKIKKKKLLSHKQWKPNRNSYATQKKKQESL